MTAPVTVPPLPEAQHRLDLYEPGSLTGAAVVCLGGPGNECRWWCAEPGADCEQCSPGEHAWTPTSSCRIADWINNCGVEDTYAGDDAVLRWQDWGDEEKETQPGIHSGLIETEWTGDDYVWSYPEEQPA